MSTKSQLLDKITLNLEDGSNIPAELHREVEDLIVENLYPDTIVDNNGGTPIVFSATSPYLTDYRICTKKQGNIVHITGYFKVNTVVAGSFNLFTILDDEYKPNLPNSYYSMGTTATGKTVPLRMNPGTISFSVIPAEHVTTPSGENIYFNLFYYTE